jgi:hypothetical protein
MTSRRLLVIGLVTLLAVATPARAEHAAAPTVVAEPPTVTVEPPTVKVEPPATERTLDLTLKLGLHGFRLGSRLFGRDGYAGGAWLNGETRPDGFSLDGRIEHDGKAHNFKLNADIDEWLRTLLRWRSGALDL